MKTATKTAMKTAEFVLCVVGGLWRPNADTVLQRSAKRLRSLPHGLSFLNRTDWALTQNATLWLGDMLLYHAGTPQPFDAATASAYLKSNRDIHLRLRFTLGSGQCTFWTCDLGYEYVRLNAEYTT
jgi:hypothetical protein